MAEFLTDDFQYGGQATRFKKEALDWIGAGGNPTTMGNMELLYENDEVAVFMHSAEGAMSQGTVMTCGIKKDGKFSSWRIVRQAL